MKYTQRLQNNKKHTPCTFYNMLNLNKAVLCFLAW